MSFFDLFKRSKTGNHPPTKVAEVHFTQGHRLTLAFLVQLLETLRDKQHDYAIDDILEVHIQRLTDIYIHVITHLKSTGDTPGSDAKP